MPFDESRQPILSCVKIDRFIHVNVVCTNFDRTLTFYTEVLGASVLEEMEADDDTRAQMGVGPEGAARSVAALVYWGDRNGPYVDILQWRHDGVAPATTRSPLQAQDTGWVRIALEVDDLDAWRSHLMDHDVPLLGDVVERRVGPWDVRFMFFTDPDGTMIELVEFPHGRGRRNVA